MDLHSVVRAILNEADPMGLRVVGAPLNEYDPEVGTIVPRLKDASSMEAVQTILHEEFSRWFSERSAGPPDRYEAPARRIWKVLEEAKEGWLNTS